MAAQFILALLLLTPVFASGQNASLVEALHAAECDSLTAVKQSTYGCSNFQLKNSNPGKKDIAGFRLELVTPGLSWEGTASVQNWSVVMLSPTILEFSGSGTTLRYGVVLPIGNVCLSTVCQTGGDYVVRYKTFNQGSQLCTGTVTLSCQKLDPGDSLDVVVNGTNVRCHDLTLNNHNSAFLPLNGLEISPLSAETTLMGSATNNWKVQPGMNNSILFLGESDLIRPADSRSGYKVCFNQVPQGKDTVSLLWKSMFNGLPVTIDTIRLTLAKETRCDSAAITHSAGEDGSTCYSTDIFNLHEPEGAVTSVIFQVQSPDAVLLPGASGPWPITQETPIFLRFATSGGGILQGDSIKGFSYCILNTGAEDSVTVRITTRDGLSDNCYFDMTVYCPATVGARCDRFTFNRMSGASYRLGVVNTRLPSLPLNTLSIDILNSGPTFDSVSAPINWIIADSDPTALTFSTSVAPIGVGGSQSGFNAGFAFTGINDSVVLRLCTSFSGQNACCDTIVLPLSKFEIRCDSLILEKTGRADECTWRAGFVNTHLPASETTSFRLSALDEGVTMRLPTAPAGWSVIADGSAGEISLLRDTATEDSLSFEMEFLSTTQSGTMLLEWCTDDSRSVICCATTQAQCTPIVRCDGLEEDPASQGFERRLRILNDHTPDSDIDALWLTMTTPGAAFASTSLPQGWTSTPSPAADTLFIELSTPLGTGQFSEWFTLNVTPAPGCDSIRYSWCTQNDTNVICCGNAPAIPCANSCDTLQVETDPGRPCCFDLSVRNGKGGAIDRVTLRILTPGTVAFTTTVVTPAGWDSSADTLMQTWSTTSSPILAGMTQGEFSICYDNSATGNQDFQVVWETYTGRTVRCFDTLTIACDRTLDVELLDAARPASMQLFPSYPNPFRSSTQVTFSLPNEETVSIEVYDTHGRRVAALCSGRYAPGSYRLTFDGSALPAGTYLLRMNSETEVHTRLLKLIR